ncbi:PQQ-binding-like beta-propeller repeat protein [bacterium]|nr:PQQ-binding-like beta-propeller repeat protein [bacterium]
MLRRVSWLVILLALTAGSCGGDTDEILYRPTYWDSPRFEKLVLSADGRYLSVENGGVIQLSNQDLTLISEIDPGLVPGNIGHRDNLPGQPVEPEGYRVYTTIWSPAASAREYGQAHLACLDETGGICWQADLSSHVGYNAFDMVIGADGRHFLCGQLRTQAIGPAGEQLWVSEPGAETLYAAADGTLYALGWGGELHALAADGSLQWSVTAADLADTIGSLHSAELLPAGNLLVVFDDSEIFAITAAGELAWHFEENAEDIHRGYISGTVSADGRLYFVVRQGDYIAEPYGHYEYSYSLAALDAATGTAVLSVPLTDGDYFAILGCDADGNLVAARRDVFYWNQLRHYNAAGVEVKRTWLAHHGESLLSASVSAAGVIYYQSLVTTAPDKQDYMLVAMDLDGNEINTVTTDKGRWVTEPIYDSID